MVWAILDMTIDEKNDKQEKQFLMKLNYEQQWSPQYSHILNFQYKKYFKVMVQYQSVYV